MPTLQVHNINHEPVADIDLPDAVFGAEVKEHLLFAVVRYQLAKRRQGTSQAKTRSEVRGGGRKPFRQKGTGRARQGTIRAPQWKGGGVVHGPRPRSHAFKLNKRVRREALRCALSRRVQENAVVIMDDLNFDEARTRLAKGWLARFELSDALVVAADPGQNLLLSTRNLKEVTVLPPGGVNVYDILRRRNLVMTRDAVNALVERLAG